jgi:DNA-binding XRE family transcriptional regulator
MVIVVSSVGVEGLPLRHPYIKGEVPGRQAQRGEKVNIIEKRRSELGISQRRLAEMIGVERYSVSKWERGHRRPAPEVLSRLYLALGLDAEEIASLYLREETP